MLEDLCGTCVFSGSAIFNLQACGACVLMVLIGCFKIYVVRVFLIKGSARVLERDSPKIFLTPSFFHHLNQPGPLTNGLKYFRIWFRYRQDIRILVLKKLTPRSIILRRVKNKFNSRP